MRTAQIRLQIRNGEGCCPNDIIYAQTDFYVREPVRMNFQSLCDDWLTWDTIKDKIYDKYQT